MPYLINSIKPRGQVAFKPHQLTVLVGANNSGKSQTLVDLKQHISAGATDNLVIVEAVDEVLPSEAERHIGAQLVQPEGGGWVLRMVSSDLQTRFQTGSSHDYLEAAFKASETGSQGLEDSQVLSLIGNSFVAHIGAEGRFHLSAKTDTYDPVTESPSNALQQFDSARVLVQPQLRAAFRAGFGVDIGLDWSGLRTLHLRVHPDFGQISDDRDALRRQMETAPLLQSQGDGFRSFAGIALSVLTFSERLLLLDEPEAFLHPAQARALGRWIAEQSLCRAGQIVVATHSADFLEGVLSGGGDAAIARLNRKPDSTRFHLIPPASAAALLQTPLLSSQPVLEALFHRGVVVCEGDPDRSIYQTVAHQFLNRREVLFIHCNGKDAAKRPLELMRQADVPVAAIMDFDVVNSSKILGDIVEAITGSRPSTAILNLREQLEASLDQPKDEEQIEKLRVAVTSWMDQSHIDARTSRRALRCASEAGVSAWEIVKKRGLFGVPNTGKAAAKQLMHELAKIGLFLVPSGELESWLCQSVSKGQKWNQAALLALHTNKCPNELEAFVRQVTDFVLDPI